MRLLHDSFICKFGVALEGHSFQGLRCTPQTEDGSSVPSLEQVIQGDNKRERQQHSLRGLNWIALTFYKAANCLSYSSARVFAFWWAPHRRYLGVGQWRELPRFELSEEGLGARLRAQVCQASPAIGILPKAVDGREEIILKDDLESARGTSRLGPFHQEDASAS